MTFCLGITSRSGLIGVADNRVTTGNEVISAGKVSTYHFDDGAMFVMTSGLRSIRDKTLTYFEDAVAEKSGPISKLVDAVNLFTAQIRRVSAEDKVALEEAGLSFDAKALIGGQFRNDPEHKLLLVYSEGNWVYTGTATPYHVIGSTGYGKPILDRALKFDDDMLHAFKVACLAFDSTRISAADVDFPMDVVLYEQGSYRMIEHRFEHEDLREMTSWWQEHLRNGVYEMPSSAINAAFAKFERTEMQSLAVA